MVMLAASLLGKASGCVGLLQANVSQANERSYLPVIPATPSITSQHDSLRKVAQKLTCVCVCLFLSLSC